MIKQEAVTKFYDQLIFPSKSSHSAYEELVDPELAKKRVGDFGCGQSLFLDKFRSLECDAIFLDIAPNALKEIDYGQKILASLVDIPLPDDYMDAVFCIGVVHHIPRIESAISELIRVVKPGGSLFLGVYAGKSIQSVLRKWYDNAQIKLVRRFIDFITGFLIWAKNRKNGLKYKSVEHLKRVDDLLRTPLVRYEPLEYYQQFLNRESVSIDRMERISQMNILVISKTK